MAVDFNYPRFMVQRKLAADALWGRRFHFVDCHATISYPDPLDSHWIVYDKLAHSFDYLDVFSLPGEKK